MSSHASNRARVIPLRPVPAAEPDAPPRAAEPADPAERAPREPLWRDVVGDVLRRERLAQERTLKDVAEAARISMPYLSELERGRKEASSEVLAAAAHALGLGLADLLALTHRRLVRQGRSRPLGSHTATRRTEASARPGDIRLAA
ncbi:helix-turn-helix domain-containing protein [Streptomyces sp. NPDC002701]|uniref:helix-turn-helix domain-containing protein n=1 Tax=Streptomyces sp. NPDC002701 TaxID=3364661 RepID=UPI0036B8E5E8